MFSLEMLMESMKEYNVDRFGAGQEKSKSIASNMSETENESHFLYLFFPSRHIYNHSWKTRLSESVNLILSANLILCN